MDFEKFKRLFLQILIGCLIAAAALAVITVILGKFNDILSKALLTLLVIAIHSLISFGFILSNERRKKSENLTVFTNATFIIIVLSFITAVFGIWGLMSWTLAGKLYLTYFVLLFAILHGEVLAETLHKEHYIDNIVYSNYVFMLIVVFMILPVIYVSDSSFLPSVYYRFLAAFGIIDATLTLLTVILHKLYLQKHPTINSAIFGLQPPDQVNSQSPQTQPAKSHRGMNILVGILIGFLALQFIGGLLALVIIGHTSH